MLTDAENEQLANIITYWFDQLKPEDWFAPAARIDQDITDRFSDQYDHFKDRPLTGMDLSGEQILAAIILLDQMPRNMFRRNAQAFATDDLALALCKMALAAGHDLTMTDLKKSFLYMPLEHSEDRKDQDLCISLFQQRTALTLQVDYAVRHCAVIARFGRFPHRNEILGRASTPEEEDFLRTGGETFSAPSDL